MRPQNLFLTHWLILGWLLFRPSAWRQYLQHLDPHLSSNVALADLTGPQWKNPQLLTLLTTSHLIAPLSISLLLTLLLSLFQLPTDTVVLTSLYGLLFGIFGGLLGSLIVSLPFGILISTLGTLLLSLPLVLTGDIIFSMEKNIAILTVFMAPQDFLTTTDLNPPQFSTLLIVNLGILVAGIAGSVMMGTTKNANSQPLYQQIGSIAIGIAVSGLTIALIMLAVGTLAYTMATLLENGILFSFAYDSLTTLLFGISLFCIALLHTGHWKTAFICGITFSLILGPLTFLKNNLYDLPYLALPLKALQGGIENAILYLLLFSFPYVLAKRIANPSAGLIAGLFGSAGAYFFFVLILKVESVPLILILIVLITALLGLSFIWWRPILSYPITAAWNLLLQKTDEQKIPIYSRLYWHSAFWDEYQYLPLFGLENYLVIVTEHHPQIGQQALDYLSNTSQRWAAQHAQIELDARRLEQLTEIKSISLAYRSLPTGEFMSQVSALLRSLSRVSRDVEAALAQESTYNQRLALDAVEERLDGLIRELTRSSEPYALRFQPIAVTWRTTIADHLQTLTRAVESRQEISNPYVVGIPLTEHQEIFVGRSDVSERIEKLLLDIRCPPLLLYGQRRTGKTSLLNNLGKLLPSTIIPLFVDLQGPTSLAKNYTGFLYNISRAMATSALRHRQLKFPALNKETLAEDPFTLFDEWLDQVEDQIDRTQALLLILDEFSALEHVFQKRLLDEESILGMFRHLIQHRPRMKILLSGSHTIDEFERWASYLINVQTLHISYLQLKEAYQLIEQPVKDFSLSYDPAAKQRLIQITRCHPALTQLVCSEIVSLKNKQDLGTRHWVQCDDIEAAIPGSLQHGRFFFADIANNQIDANGLAILRHLAAAGEGKKLNAEQLLQQLTINQTVLNTSLTHLLQRELIEAIPHQGYCFQVELIRRWFCQGLSPNEEGK